MNKSRFRLKEFVPKEKTEVTEITEPTESSVQKKSRLDTDDSDITTIADDGQMWSKPLAEARETTRLIFMILFLFIFISFLFREDEFEEYLQTLFF